MFAAEQAGLVCCSFWPAVSPAPECYPRVSHGQRWVLSESRDPGADIAACPVQPGCRRFGRIMPGIDRFTDPDSKREWGRERGPYGGKAVEKI